MNIIYHFRVKGVGPERVHISGIAGAFENLGHKVTFVSPTDINPLETGDVAPQKGRLRSLLYFFADKTPQVCFEFMEILYNLMALKKLGQAMKRVKPELIYERYAFFCFAGIYTARRTGTPIVLEINEVGGFDRVRPQKLVTLSKMFERYIFSSADLIVTVSDFLKEQIIIRGGISDRILVVPNGIDLKLFNRLPETAGVRERYKLQGKRVVGFVGYLVHWHRLDLLLKAFAEIRATYADVQLMLVGDGVLREELLRLAEELGIRDDFIITGRIDHSDVPNYIGAFDVAIIPNSNEYRSPIKLFEYMAMGKAIVAPNQPPILGVLKDGETGLIFQNGDADDLRGKISLALASGELSRNLGESAKRLVLDQYTWDRHGARILACWEKSCQEPVGAAVAET